MYVADGSHILLGHLTVLLFACRTIGGFFTTFGTGDVFNDYGEGTTQDGNVQCPSNTRATGYSFLPNDFGMAQLQVRG